MSRFIVVEGLEGAGKTTAIAIIQQFIQATFGPQQEVVLTREPGGTPLAEQLRTLVKATHTETLQPMSELLLMYAARIQLLETVIKPALARGAWVIGDRHCLSTWAYQGGGRKLGVEPIQALQQVVMPDFFPDLTLYLDISPETGLARAKARGELDRIEQEARDFFERTRAVYLQQCQVSPDKIIKIDAHQALDKVHDDIEGALKGSLCTLG